MRPLAANENCRPGLYLVKTGQSDFCYRDFLLVREGSAGSEHFGRLDSASCAIAYLGQPGSLRLLNPATGQYGRPVLTAPSARKVLEALAHTVWCLLRYPRASRLAFRRQRSAGIGLVLTWRGPDRETETGPSTPGHTLNLTEADQLYPGAHRRIGEAFARTGADLVTWDVDLSGRREPVLRPGSAPLLHSLTNDLARHSAARSSRELPATPSVLHLSETLGSARHWQLDRTSGIPLSETGISVIIPTRDRADLLRVCLEDIDRHLRSQDELILVDHGSSDREALNILERAVQKGARIVRQAGPFNYSRLVNAGAALATRDLLVLMNNDVHSVSEDWPARMAGWLEAGNAGIAGVDLRYPDGRYQHTGITLDRGGLPVHLDLGGQGDGPRGLYRQPRDVFAVTGALLGIRRETFDAVGGLDESLPHDFNDIALCLAVRARGLDVVWTPDIRGTHEESASRGQTLDSAERRSEWARLAARYPDLIETDPFVSPRIDLSPPRWRLDPKPWSVLPAPYPICDDI